MKDIQKIVATIDRVKEYESLNSRKLSEIDTQVIIVELVLLSSGYDIYDPYVIKRASRNPQAQNFDIEVYQNNRLLLAIEVKALSSCEFNIYQQSGKLFKNNHKWQNKANDGVGQLRAYCLNKKLDSSTKPILTNGIKWLIFTNDFLNEAKAEFPVDINKDAKVYDITNVHDILNLLKELSYEEIYLHNDRRDGQAISNCKFRP